MSYDLHGLWDKENPIGNVINPHNNLTEIERAVQLLWRAGVPPIGSPLISAFTAAASGCRTQPAPSQASADSRVSLREGLALTQAAISLITRSRTFSARAP